MGKPARSATFPLHWCGIHKDLGNQVAARRTQVELRGFRAPVALDYNEPMSKHSPTYRGDIMRRIAAMYAKMDSGGRLGRPVEQRVAEREELKRQIAALQKQMMDP